MKIKLELSPCGYIKIHINLLKSFEKFDLHLITLTCLLFWKNLHILKFFPKFSDCPNILPLRLTFFYYCTWIIPNNLYSPLELIQNKNYSLEKLETSNESQIFSHGNKDSWIITICTERRLIFLYLFCYSIFSLHLHNLI